VTRVTVIHLLLAHHASASLRRIAQHHFTTQFFWHLGKPLCVVGDFRAYQIGLGQLGV
jgi:hypothetical protein